MLYYSRGDTLKKWIVKILILILVLAGLIWFVTPISHNVLNIGNIMGIAVCVLVFVCTAFSGVIKKISKNSKPVRIFCRTVSVLFGIGILWAAVLTGCMIYGANAFGTRSVIPKDATVIVLGSKVSGKLPSADLMARINAAGVYLKSNAQAKCIVSGGQGAGELVTEASVMKTYLVKQGIDASHILIEDKSTTTEENLKNSLKMIQKNSLSSHVAIVTDEYHEFRAGRIAKNVGMTSYAVCAQTPWYILSACYGRELLALTKFVIIP